LIVLLRAVAAGERYKDKLLVRQATNPCASQCESLAPLSACADNDSQCECSVIVSGTALSCAQCWNNYNETLALEILSLENLCLSLGLSSTSGLSSAIPASISAGAALTTSGISATAFSSAGSSSASISSPTSLPASCVSACENYDLFITCATTDIACACSPILGYGPLCSSCYSTRNATFASLVAGLVNTCQQFASLGLTNTTSRSTSATTTGPIVIGSGAESPVSSSGARRNTKAIEVVGVYSWYITIWIGVIAGLFIVWL
jgi:hypothetical protein